MINNEYEEGEREKKGVTAIHFVMVIKLMSVVTTNHMTCRIDKCVLCRCTVDLFALLEIPKNLCTLKRDKYIFERWSKRKR